MADLKQKLDNVLTQVGPYDAVEIAFGHLGAYADDASEYAFPQAIAKLLKDGGNGRVQVMTALEPVVDALSRQPEADVVKMPEFRGAVVALNAFATRVRKPLQAAEEALPDQFTDAATDPRQQLGKGEATDALESLKAVVATARELAQEMNKKLPRGQRVTFTS